MQENAVVTICRCGWLEFNPSFGDATIGFSEHKDEVPETKHDPRKVFNVRQPIEDDALETYKRMAYIEACKSLALDRLESWKKAEPSRVEDDGLGAFRGMWTLVKWYALAGVVALACWGLWRLQ